MARSSCAGERTGCVRGARRDLIAASASRGSYSWRCPNIVADLALRPTATRAPVISAGTSTTGPRACRRQYRPVGTGTGSVLIPGLVDLKLLEAARLARADLVVSAARTTAPLLPDTVTQYVLRDALCTVLIVHATSRRSR